MKTYRITDYKNAKKTISHYMQNKREYAFLHYACQSFYETVNDTSPRITAIAVMFAATKQTKVFSISTIADRESKDLKNATENNLDEFELKMLTEFYACLKSSDNSIKHWCHWNMKDQNYGFEAIAQRYCKLSKKKKAPFTIDNEKRLNIASLLMERYGENYADHQRLPHLMDMNNIQPQNYMSGEDEAKAYDNREFMRIERSVQAKVHVFAEIMDKVGNTELKTKSKLLKDIYGLSFVGVVTYLKENVLFGLLASIIGGVIIDLIVDWIKSLF